VESKPAALEAVEDVKRSPGDREAVSNLAYQLRKILSEDRALAVQIGELTNSLKLDIDGDVTGSQFAIGSGNIQTIIHKAPRPSSPPALHQLPAPPGDFIGREAELNELLAKIKEGGVTISGLRGMGGIGKTALALVLAHRLKPDYPDAQIYLDLKATSQTPLT